MSVVWAWPIGLAAFVAVLLPIWLHLDRRRRMRVLRFAAMRFIGAAHPPQRTWRLLEWLLLALRVLLLVAVVIWLAQPTWVGEWRAPQRVLAVVPGMPDSLIGLYADGIDRAVWLNSTLAEIDLAKRDVANTDPSNLHPSNLHPSNLELARTLPVSHLDQPPFASLLRQLDAQLAPRDELRVLLGEQVSGLDAQAIGLSREVEWKIAGTNLPAESEPSTTAESPLKRTLAIRYEAADAPALRWLRAAIDAWASDAAMQVTRDDQPAAAALPGQVDALIWVGDEPTAAAKASLIAGGRLLHLRSRNLRTEETESTADGLEVTWPGHIQRVGLGQKTTLSTRFEPREMPILHSPEFPAALFAALFGEPPAPTRAYASLIEPVRITAQSDPSTTPLRSWLGWLIASLFLLERAFASGRRLRGVR